KQWCSTVSLGGSGEEEKVPMGDFCIGQPQDKLVDGDDDSAGSSLVENGQFC
ncbi:hypothetical protein A2U01_0047968, partial [Trifolium medium]|nr:hypothetical protein [Trifolium medium]